MSDPIGTSPRTFGLPCDESPERDAVCDLLTKELLAVGEVAYHAGERVTVDLRSEQEVRGLLRFMTAVDGEGRDGPFGERKQATWRQLGRVLSSTATANKPVSVGTSREEGTAPASREDAIRERLKAASPGPWKVCGALKGKCPCRLVWSEPADVIVAVAKVAAELQDEGPNDFTAIENARLIANAPADLEYLLSELSSLRESLEGVKQPKPVTIRDINSAVRVWNDCEFDSNLVRMKRVLMYDRAQCASSGAVSSSDTESRQ